MRKMDIVDLTIALNGFIKDPAIKLSDLSKEEKLQAYKDAFGEEVQLKQFFVQVNYYNPCSHEMDWCIVSNENKETLSEENAMMFDTVEQASLWTSSEEAKGWLPCSFEIKESVY